jgi:hypothetical protein
MDVQGLSPNPVWRDLTVEEDEVFPDVQLWEAFDEACARAEAVREDATARAAKERDRVVDSLRTSKVHSPNPIRQRHTLGGKQSRRLHKRSATWLAVRPRRS